MTEEPDHRQVGSGFNCSCLRGGTDACRCIICLVRCRCYELTRDEYAALDPVMKSGCDKKTGLCIPGGDVGYLAGSPVNHHFQEWQRR